MSSTSDADEPRVSVDTTRLVDFLLGRSPRRLHDVSISEIAALRQEAARAVATLDKLLELRREMTRQLQAPEPGRLLTVEDVARILDLDDSADAGRRAVYRLVREKRLRVATRSGRRNGMRFTRAALDSYLLGGGPGAV